MRTFDAAVARSTPPVATQPDRACNGVDTRIFFPEKGETSKAARQICGLCPHRAPCLEWAIETQQAFGVLGGTGPEERERLIKARLKAKGAAA